MKRVRERADQVGLLEPRWRFEFKYRIPYPTALRVRALLRSEMRIDEYSSAMPGGRYSVKSLYFDTQDDAAFHAKMAGDTNRVKFRVRTYRRSRSENGPIQLELKVRRGDASGKVVAPVREEDLDALIAGRARSLAGAHPAIDEFLRAFHRENLRPKIVTMYQREGFRERDGGATRVTMDHLVRSVASADLFASDVFARPHHRHWVVLEIKSFAEQSFWLNRLVRQFGLKVVANSKFTQAMQACRPELHHATGIVTIR